MHKLPREHCFEKRLTGGTLWSLTTKQRAKRSKGKRAPIVMDW
jgi:hypothetical protein